MRSIPQKVEIDFTDEAITASAGSIFLSRVADSLGLRDKLQEALKLKKRQRGASDEDTLLSVIYCLAQGDGKLVDVDRLRADEPRAQLLGLDEVPGSRRLSDYLARFDKESVDRLRGVALQLARMVGREVARHEEETLGYVPVFVDGTAIEVSGEYFEGARPGYNEQTQYWQHSVYLGRLWVSQELRPGGVGVTCGWRKQLEEAEPLLDEIEHVWVRVDNAYYSKGVVKYCRDKDWDYSISVTNDTYKIPLREEVAALHDDDWSWINDDQTEEAALIYHQPHDWEQEEAYVVVRSYWDGSQKRLTPRHTFILVSRTDLPLDELVRRHRGKQGQENAQKGPLIDLDLHHPPCSRYQANRAFYTAGQIAQILLCGVQYYLLPTEAREHGIRTIIRELVRTAGRLVRHSRRWILRFAKTALRLDWISHAADRLEMLPCAPR
jgi:hypothetical protein